VDDDVESVDNVGTEPVLLELTTEFTVVGETVVDAAEVDVVVPNEDAVDVVVDTDGNVSVASEAVNVVV